MWELRFQGDAKQYQHCRPERRKEYQVKGAFYEQSFTDGRGVREKAKERAESTEKMLNDEFRKLGDLSARL